MTFDDWLKESLYASVTGGQALTARRAFEAGRLHGLREAQAVARKAAESHLQQAEKFKSEDKMPFAKTCGQRACAAANIADSIAGRAG